MRELLLPYLTKRIPYEFVVQLPGALEGAYFEAYQHSKEKCAEPERARVRGQLRNYYQNGSLRSLGERLGIDSTAPHTSPKGERYTQLVINDLVMGRTSVKYSNKMPNPAKHRKTIASLNERFEPVTTDMFDDVSAVPSEGIGVLLVTVNAAPKGDQSVPSHFVVGVPYSNLKGWHLFEPLTNFAAGYNPITEQVGIDIAFPTLKKMLRKAEGGN